MCTVTYIPTETNGEFIFTSNRDEAPNRSATGLIIEKENDKRILFPRDAKANGTWIAISDQHQLVCILNGAFIKHKHSPPYRLSRGIMALDFFKYKHAIDFLGLYSFEGIEPFTMIIYDKGSLYEFRWDESKKHIKKLDPLKAHIWASCTLYSSDWVEKRKTWFNDWQKKTSKIDTNSVLDFHRNAGEGNPEYDVVMNRSDIVRTTSITTISKQQNQMNMRYEDLLDGELLNQNLKFPAMLS